MLKPSALNRKTAVPASPATRPVVVILDSSLAVTGGLRGAQRIAFALSPYARTILVLPSRSKVEPDQLHPFAGVERLPLVQVRKSVKDLLLYGPALLASSFRLIGLLRRHKAQALVVNDFFQLQGFVVRRLGWKGRIVTWVRFDPRRFPAPLRRLLLGAARSASDSIVAVSKSVQRSLPADLATCLVYDPIGEEIEAAPRGHRRDFVCIGNYIVGKGQEQILGAFAMIAARFPMVRLHFHGGDLGLEKNRQFRARLEEQAVALGLAGRVEFHGFLADAGKPLSHAVAAINLSQNESFSLTCLEAQQAGVPVIAYRCGGPEEIIEDGVTGYLLPLNDMEGVAAAMTKLLENPATALRMGEAGATRVRRKFAPDIHAGLLRKLLF